MSDVFDTIAPDKTSGGDVFDSIAPDSGVQNLNNTSTPSLRAMTTGEKFMALPLVHKLHDAIVGPMVQPQVGVSGLLPVVSQLLYGNIKPDVSKDRGVLNISPADAFGEQSNYVNALAKAVLSQINLQNAGLVGLMGPLGGMTGTTANLAKSGVAATLAVQGAEGVGQGLGTRMSGVQLSPEEKANADVGTAMGGLMMLSPLGLGGKAANPNIPKGAADRVFDPAKNRYVSGEMSQGSREFPFTGPAPSARFTVSPEGDVFDQVARATDAVQDRPRQETVRPAYAEPVMVGGQTLPKGTQILTPEMLSQSPTTITPAQGATFTKYPVGDVGGQVSFRGEGVPSAIQGREVLPGSAPRPIDFLPSAKEDVHGGGEGQLTPEQQAQSRQNNSREAFEKLAREQGTTPPPKADSGSKGKVYGGLFFMDPDFWKDQVRVAGNVKMDATQLYNRIRNGLGKDSGTWKALDSDAFKQFMFGGGEGGRKSPDEVKGWMERNGPKENFSLMGSDKPSKGNVAQLAPGIGQDTKLHSGIPTFDPELWGVSKEELEKLKTKFSEHFEKGIESPVTLPPLPNTPEKSIKTSSNLVTKTVNAISGFGVDRSLDEAVKHFSYKQQGYSVPRTSAASSEVANRLVRYASAEIAAPQYAKALATKVLEQADDTKLGSVIVEDILREIKSKVGPEAAKRIISVMSDDEYKKTLADPFIKEAIKRHQDIVEPIAREAHVALGGTLEKGGKETGAFVNLMAILDESNPKKAEEFATGKSIRPLTDAPQRKGSLFEHKRTGFAPKYEVSYRTIAERMIKGNYKRVAWQNLEREYIKSGLAKIGNPGETAPEIGGKPANMITVQTQATPWGTRGQKNLWVRADLMPELKQAINGSDVVKKSGISMLLDLATEAQVIGPTDFVFHAANMYASIAYDLGAKSTELDLVRQGVPLMKDLDAIGRIGYNMYRVIIDSPKIQEQLAHIAKIGALRGEAQSGKLVTKIPVVGRYLDTARWIRTIDKAGRLARNDMFDNLVKRQLVKDTEMNRREFINKMGQYNAKLMSKFQAFQRQYFSQFVVAGRTFNRNAFQRMIASNSAQALNPAAYWKMKGLNLVGLFSALVTVPVVVNSMLHKGHPFGRPGTPIGSIDTGKNDKDGRPIYIDPLQTTLLRRGMRITGVQALSRDIERHKGIKDTALDMVKDIANGQISPWAGPPVRMGYTAMTGKSIGLGGFKMSKDTDSIEENLKAALTQVNPTVSTFVEGKQNDESGTRKVVERLGASVGYTKGAFPTHEQKVSEMAGQDVTKLSLQDRVKAERQYKKTEAPMSKDDQAKAAERNIANITKRGQEVTKELSKESQQWIHAKGLEDSLPGFDNKVKVGGTTVYLTDDETEKLSGLVKDEYEKTISQLRKQKSTITKDVLNEQLTYARARARAAMVHEMSRSKNEQNNQQTTNKRFSIIPSN